MPGRSRKGKNDSLDTAEKLSKSPDVEETSEMTSTETEAPAINLMTGMSPIERTRNGAGRKRDHNPFDELVESLYNDTDPAGVEFTDEEHKNLLRNQIKNAVSNHNKENGTSYGVEFGVNKDTPNILRFNVKDKVAGRGRKPGSKKIDGHFYNPDEMDANGNPLPEARAAKENPSAEAAETVDS